MDDNNLMNQDLAGGKGNTGSVKSDLVWDSETQTDSDRNHDSHNNNDRYNEDEDDISFKSANTSTSSSDGNSPYNYNNMYSSLEESFITYAHDSTILSPSSHAANTIVMQALGNGDDSGDDNSDYDDDDDSESSSFDSGKYIDAFAEQQQGEATVDGNVTTATATVTANNTIKKEQIQTGIIICTDQKKDYQSKLPNCTDNNHQKNETCTTKRPTTIDDSKATTKNNNNQEQQQQQQQPQQSSSSSIPISSSSSSSSSFGTIQSFTFNQDKNCIAIATSSGYRIRTLPSPSSLLDTYNNNNNEYNKKDNDFYDTNDTNHHHRVKVHQVIYPPPKAQLSSSSSSSTISTTHHTHNRRGHIIHGISHIQILHSTSVIAIVKNATPRIVSILHAKTAQCVMEIPFTNAIRRIEMNIRNLVVLTADGLIHVFRLKGGSTGSGSGSTSSSTEDKGIEFVKTIPILHKSESARMITADNAKTASAFFDLSSHLFSCHDNDDDNDAHVHTSTSTATTTTLNDNKSSWLVTKSNKGVGYISVYKTTSKIIFLTKEQTGNSKETLSPTKSKPKMNIVKKTKECMELVTTVQAHSHGIMRIAIGGANDTSKVTNKILATTSLKGTVIRIFSLPNCYKLYELHRGTSSCTTFSMSFNFDASMLAVSSSRGTVHVFNIVEAAKITQNHCEEEQKKSRKYGNEQIISSSSSSTTSSSIHKKWYDGFLSSIKSSRNNNDQESKPIIIRSIAKIRFRKPIVPNTIAMLPILSKNNNDEKENDCVAICFEDGKLLVYAIAKTSSRLKKNRPRPVLADDIMFDSEPILS